MFETAVDGLHLLYSTHYFSGPVSTLIAFLYFGAKLANGNRVGAAALKVHACWFSGNSVFPVNQKLKFASFVVSISGEDNDY